MYTGVKSLILKYKKPFNKDVKAQAKAKSRLREEGKSINAKAVETEKLVVLSEWDLKTKQGEQAHEEIVRRKLKKFPKAIVGKYKKHESSNPLPAESINKLDLNSRYYEKLVVDNQNMIIGYVDEVFVDEKGYINIQDVKSHNEIRRTYTAKASNGFTIVENFYYPVTNLIDCNFIECALQVSFYMYTLWTYNKKLKPGKLTMMHVKLDEATGAIINEQILELPYLIDEVKAIIKHQKEIT